jgi:hypothetical protein
MALESGTYIDSLVATNPVSTDGLAAADDHMRLIKATILASFPNITGAMTATHSVLNGLDARMTAIETAFASGTKMLFQQSTAPTGWTKDTTHDDKALRVVTGTAGSGGTNAFSTLDATAAGTVNSSISGSTAGHTLTISQIPSHTHSQRTDRVQEGFDNGTSYAGYSPSAGNHSPTTWNIGYTGGGGSHSHGAGSLAVTSTFTGSANALDVQFVDVIIATKD